MIEKYSTRVKIAGSLFWIIVILVCVVLPLMGVERCSNKAIAMVFVAIVLCGAAGLLTVSLPGYHVKENDHEQDDHHQGS